jgi:GNAT superfamily N-acetyltransferase
VEINIRSATKDDLPAIAALAPRLHEFGPPPWRAVDQMNATVIETLTEALDDPKEENRLLIANDSDGRIVEFIYLLTTTDFFTKENHGHVSDLVVAREGEGRGVGRALLAAAENWARGRGYRLLSLKVFGENARAKRIYEEIGYSTDTIKMVKEL